jgi:hypothetical protein
MAEPAGPIVHGTMRGGGYDSAVTRGANDAIGGAIPLVRAAIRRLPDANASRPFTLVDIGCADGGTSINLVHQTILGVCARWPRRPLMVVYTDQPRHDANSLSQLIHGLTPTSSYLDTVDDIYVLATATSFYRPLVPPGTLDLGFSAAAMHWLNRKPGDLPAHIQAVGAWGGDLAAFAGLLAIFGTLLNIRDAARRHATGGGHDPWEPRRSTRCPNRRSPRGWSRGSPEGAPRS